MIEIFVTQPEFAEGEQRILRSLIGERIDPGDGMAQYAIGVNEAVDTRLQRAFPYLHAGLGCSRSSAIAHWEIA